MAAPGQPNTPVVPVRGGAFGGDTEATIGQLLTAAFGEGAVEAIAEITAAKAKEITAKREADEKKQAAEDAKAEKEAEKAEKAAHLAEVHHKR